MPESTLALRTAKRILMVNHSRAQKAATNCPDIVSGTELMSLLTLKSNY
jgi:hypothetical protein